MIDTPWPPGCRMEQLDFGALTRGLPPNFMGVEANLVRMIDNPPSSWRIRSV